MRRAPIVLLATAAGVGSVLGFHPAKPPAGLASPASASAGASGTSGVASGTSGASPSTASGAKNAQGSSSSRPATRSASKGRGAVPTTTTPPVPAGARSATGVPENYGYGVLSVKVSVSGAHITGLAVARLQTADSYSQQIADQVIPMLRKEVLNAQSAQVNGFTGATYTTEAYLYSVQAALDKLHVK